MSLTQNTRRGKKNYQGAIDKIYLFPYVKYSRSQIVTTGQYLTTFPATTIYETYSSTDNFNETPETEGGAVGYRQSFSMQVYKTEVTNELHTLNYQLYRAIYIDNIGNIRILGLKNGLEVQVSNETGANKTDLNGYRLTFTGQEDNQAYWIEDLSTWFTILAEDDNFIFMDGCNFVFTNDDNFIFI